VDYLITPSMVQVKRKWKEKNFYNIKMLLEILVPFKDQSYIFSLSGMEWRNGPPMPRKLRALGSVQLDDGFMIIGGFDDSITKGSYVSQTIDNNYNWNVNPNAFDFDARYFVEGVRIPDDFLAC